MNDAKAFEKFAAQYDTLGNKWQDMGADEYFKAGWQAACEWLDNQNTLWRNAAIRVGEDLHSVGPNGYYNMSAEEWLNWALSTICSKPNSAPPAAQINQQLLGALEHLYHNAKKSGANMGLALDVAKAALAAAKETK